MKKNIKYVLMMMLGFTLILLAVFDAIERNKSKDSKDVDVSPTPTQVVELTPTPTPIPSITIAPTVIPTVEPTPIPITFEDEVSELNYEISEDYLIQYKELLKKYDKVYDINELFTEDEIYLMQRCVETEVFGATFEQKVHVGSVIMNRLAHSGFPNTVEKVITTPRQFAYFRTTITESTKSALEYAILVGDTVDGCFSFRSDIRPDTWYGWKFQFFDGVHNFYK